MSELRLEARDGTVHNVTWVDAPEEVYADELPYFSLQTQSEQALRAGVPVGRKKPRRTFRRQEQLACGTWLYEETS